MSSPTSPSWPPEPWKAAIARHDPAMIPRVLDKFESVGAPALVLAVKHAWPEAWDAWWERFKLASDTGETGAIIAHVVHHQGAARADQLLEPVKEHDALLKEIQTEAFLVAVAQGWRQDLPHYGSWGVDFAVQNNMALIEALRRQPPDAELITLLWPTARPEHAPSLFGEALAHGHLDWAHKAWDLSADPFACAHAGLRYAIKLPAQEWAPTLFDQLKQARGSEQARQAHIAFIEAMHICARANDLAWLDRLSTVLSADDAFRASYEVTLGEVPTVTQWAMAHLWPRLSDQAKWETVPKVLHRGSAHDLDAVWTSNIPVARQVDWLRNVVIGQPPALTRLADALKAKLDWDAIALWSPNLTSLPITDPPMADTLWDQIAADHVPSAVRRAWVDRWGDRLPQARTVDQAERRHEQAQTVGPSRSRSPRSRT